MPDFGDAVYKAFSKAAARALTDLTDRMVQIAKVHAPKGKTRAQGGKSKGAPLRGSIQRQSVVATATGWETEFGAYGVPHAAPQEYGSAGRGEPFAPRHPMVSRDWDEMPPGKKTFAPYKILPKERKALRWEVRGAPKKLTKAGKPGQGRTLVRYAKSVTHPGVEPQPFLRPAIDIVRLRESETIIRDALRIELPKHLREEFT